MSRPRTEQRTAITDVRVLAALSHPARVRLLDLLMAGPRTATSCAQAVGLTPSACSYHLRHLARFGMLERVEAEPGDDGRERRWRTTATGFDFAAKPSQDGPTERSIRRVLSDMGVDEGARLAKEYAAGAKHLPAAWQDAAHFTTYHLAVTPAELRTIADRIDAIVRPFIAITRDDAPASAAPVRMSLQAFRRPDA